MGGNPVAILRPIQTQLEHALQQRFEIFGVHGDRFELLFFTQQGGRFEYVDRKS